MQDYLDMAPCGYFSFNDEGFLTDINSTACSLLDYKKQDLLAKSVESIFTLASRIFYQTHLLPLLRLQGHIEEIFVSLQGAQGRHVPVLLNANSDEVDGVRKYACAFITVYHRKKFEEELVFAKKQAEQSLLESSEHQRLRKEVEYHAEMLDEQLRLVYKKNDELKQFNRVVTHELQEPLRKISIFTQQVVENAPPSGKMVLKQALEKLIISTMQMGAVISGLQQFIWLQEATLHPAELDLNLLIQRIFKETEKPAAPESVNLIADIIPPIFADAAQMKLLFDHLISNAIRFRKRGQDTRIEIRSTVIERNKFTMLTEKFRYDKYLKLDICDNGIGFDAVYKDHVFELFRRLHTHEGRGVGLALCREIVENHKGSISIDSKLNKGTVVTVILPLGER